MLFVAGLGGVLELHSFRNSGSCYQHGWEGPVRLLGCSDSLVMQSQVGICSVDLHILHFRHFMTELRPRGHLAKQSCTLWLCASDAKNCIKSSICAAANMLNSPLGRADRLACRSSTGPIDPWTPISQQPRCAPKRITIHHSKVCSATQFRHTGMRIGSPLQRIRSACAAPWHDRPEHNG